MELLTTVGEMVGSLAALATVDAATLARADLPERVMAPVRQG
jgi:hypothetical protein